MTRLYLRAIWPYLKQVSGLLLIGSLGGIVMNTAVVLPAVLLGRAIDAATAWSAGRGTGADVLRAGLVYVGAMALYQGARLVKRWGLRVGHQRIVASVRGAGNPGGVNPEVPGSWAADRTRPLCPYPNVARYLGRGDVEQASSWACLGPVRSRGR